MTYAEKTHQRAAPCFCGVLVTVERMPRRVVTYDAETGLYHGCDPRELAEYRRALQVAAEAELPVEPEPVVYQKPVVERRDWRTDPAYQQEVE